MANVDDAYCAESDLRTGDLEPPTYTTKAQYIQNAAEEIEAAIGHIYVTPIIIDEQIPANRPSILFLKKINWLLASGRFILDVAAAGEMDSLHAYGKRMLDEANAMIQQILDGLVLVGVPRLDADKEKDFTGPVIFNEDSESMVEKFYRQRRPSVLGLPVLPDPVMPYDKR